MSAGVHTARRDRFIDHLYDLVKENRRGELAALRRGLGKEPGAAPEMYPHVMAFNPPPWQENDYFLVASLFALWHQGGSGQSGSVPRNLGESFRRVADQTDSESIERRFVALLNAHKDDLPSHLRHAVSLMRSADRQVPVNWSQLLDDLGRWNSEFRSVQRQWARGFWGRLDQPDEEQANS
jgi:CRISPR system Cascade subunit CasB